MDHVIFFAEVKLKPLACVINALSTNWTWFQHRNTQDNSGHTLRDTMACEEEYMSLVMEGMDKNFRGFTLDGYSKSTVNLVFHTWVSSKSIPDGTFVVDGMLLNYVANIKAQAHQLQRCGIPVMIVYSRLDLPRLEETKLIFAFREESNIVVLCLEDMTEAIPADTYLRYFYTNESLTTRLPLVVLHHAKDVVQFLWRTACDQGKKNYAMSLDSNTEANAIMYLDMDISFTTDTVPSIYTKNGMCTWPELNFRFTHERTNLSMLTPRLAQLAQSHTSHMLKDDWRALFKYVSSGQAYQVSDMLTLARGNKLLPAIATGNSSMILMEYSKIPELRALSVYTLKIDDLHTAPILGLTETSDPEYREHHTLVYLQVHRYMKKSEPNDWMSDESAWMSE